MDASGCDRVAGSFTAKIGDLLANASVPPGTCTSATLTLSANPGDVTLIVSADSEPASPGQRDPRFHRASPEELVLNVSTSTAVLTVAHEDGLAVPVTINGNTQFFFRTPGNGAADASLIGTGTGFLSNLVRGFKVHVSIVDPLANRLVAQTVDIETAAFIGVISATGSTRFTDTRSFIYRRRLHR